MVEPVSWRLQQVSRLGVDQVLMVPRVSVLMPVYNGARYLRPAVQSILAQTFSDFEFVIIDDGSTDRSPALLRRYAARDPRIRILTQPRAGIVDALNAGIAAARADLIARMDADDISRPQRIATQVAYLDAHPEYGVVGSEVLIIDPAGWPVGPKGQKLTHEEIDAVLMDGRGGAIIHPSAMIRAAVLRAVGGYRKDLEWAEDYDLFLRLAEMTRMANLPEILLEYRQHFHRTTETRRAEQMARIRQAVTEAWQRRGLGLPTAEVLRPVGNPTRVERRAMWARSAMRYGQRRTAVKHALAILASTPYCVSSWRLLGEAAGVLKPKAR